MNDLSKHLAPDASHARLPFHLGCALCREERLFGAYGGRPLVSRRLGLGATAAMLLLAPSLPAVAAATPPASAPATAGEQDSEHEGTGQAGPSPGTDGDRPESDMDGGDSDQVEENSPSLVSPGDKSNPDDGESESGPVETSPPQEEAGMPEQQGNTPGPGPPTPTNQAPPSPQEAPPKDEAGQEGAPPEAPRTDGSEIKSDRPSPRTDRPRSRNRPDKRRSHAGDGPSTSAPPGPAPRSTEPLEPTFNRQDAVTSDDLATGRDGRKGRGAEGGSARSSSATDIHIVRPGESLWSIATAHLDGAPTPAQVAREVERLWRLNADGIGTGDPDLLLVGQKVRLR